MVRPAGFASPTGLAWALFSGLATVVPLVLFAWSARRLPLSTIGFIQFPGSDASVSPAAS